MTKSGFVMPTVLGFILLVSSIVLIQGMSTIYQLIGLEANKHSTIELSIYMNVAEVISNLEFDSSCEYEQELGYDLAGVKVSVTSNCLYSELKGAENNRFEELLVKNELTVDEFEQIKIDLLAYSSEKSENKNVMITSHEQNVESSYEQEYKIIVVEVSGQLSLRKVIVVDSYNNIVRNINVK